MSAKSEKAPLSPEQQLERAGAVLLDISKASPDRIEGPGVHSFELPDGVDDPGGQGGGVVATLQRADQPATCHTIQWSRGLRSPPAISAR